MNIDELKIQNYILSKGCYYSCDMLRIRFELRDDMMKPLYRIIENFQYNFGLMKYQNNFGYYKYKNFWSFDGRNGNIRVLQWLNGDKREDMNKGYLEFNPNKCRMSLIMPFLRDIRLCCWSFELASFDIAIDMPMVERMNVMLVKDGRKYQLIESKGARTEYLGVHHKNGFVKLYDKQKESSLSYPCTRLELTYEADVKDFHYPEVLYCLSQKEMIFDLNSTMQVLVDLLNSLEYSEMLLYYRRLSANTRTKIKGYLNGAKEKFIFDLSAINNVKEYINSIVGLTFSPDVSKEIRFMQPEEKMQYDYWVPIPRDLDEELEKAFKNAKESDINAII